MAQRDKIKELVGRGLNSYHTKALQQMDRIEKKNKEQNHKISILSNELDNDYLTKTEEGSVVSLEHSKEGMIYLDELQGNTLVNYCTDGSKEMTLNGDIDLEGTFVTTTEGVDNGKVDVMCEGNTLVNLNELSKCRNYKSESGLCEITVSTDVAWNEVGVSGKFLVYKLKPNTVYTVFMDIKKNTIGENSKFYLNITAENRAFLENYAIDSGYIGNIIKKVTTRPDLSNVDTGLLPSIKDAKQGQNIAFKYMILEGDWTNREIPKEYFEGMKSVGQDNVNGHKIEILSNNGSYFNAEDIKSYAQNLLVRVLRTKFDNVKEYFNYVNAFNSNMELGDYYYVNDDGGSAWIQIPLELKYNNNEVAKWLNSKICNKKEILMNEPLRGLPNEVRDRKVKIGGKWFIERNCAEVLLDGNLEIATYSKFTNDNEEYESIIIRLKNDNAKKSYDEKYKCVATDKIPYLLHAYPQVNSFGINQYVDSSATFVGCIPKSILNGRSLEQYFSDNPTKVVYNLATPIYEPLEIEPTLNTYNDITHISNNSIIPCNMKIQNSGYNAIIKPSTLYTVALDTNKSGTIGMNLGGAKGTTTNNVLTLTTPATLTDDSLRLYGKGIKSSKVRLLEGDKTNWMPSFFEGMKSSFEDKFDTTDNTYKMEILSYTKKLQNQLLNPNLKTHPFQRTTIDGDWNVFQWNIGDYYTSTKDVIDGDKFKNGDKVYVKFDVIKLSDAHYTDTIWCGRIGGYNTAIFSGEFYNSLPINQQKTLKTIITHNPPDSDPRTFKIDFGGYRRDIECKFKIKNITVVNLTRLYGKGNEPTIEWCDENIPYYNTNDMHYVDMNKIQFSSIEPLRSVEDTKDKFVFKDGKLMIERNCKKIIVDNKLSWVGFDTSVTPNHPRAYFLLDDYKLNKRSHCDGFGFVNADKEFRHFKAHPFSSEGAKTIVWFYVEKAKLNTYNQQGFVEYFKDNTFELVYPIKEPIYEEIPFELQKIILEGYENGTLFFDTNIPPTSTVTYAGETPIVKSVKLNKTEVLNNTNDINDNIVPYLMDMDYRVVCLQLEGGIENISMARLFGGTYEMLQRDILSNRYSKEEYKYRLDAYLGANKITEDEYNKLGDMLNE